jgi:hypothetical protein
MPAEPLAFRRPEVTMQTRGVPGAAITVNYDPDEDALYINLGTPPCGHLAESADGLVLRHASAQEPPNGITALRFNDDWRKRLPDLYGLAAKYLDRRAEDVETAITAMIPVEQPIAR